MESAITGFVLAIVVPTGAVVVWLTLERNRLSREVVQLSETFSRKLDTLTTSFELQRERLLQTESIARAAETVAKTTTAAHLSATVADLGADVAKLAHSMRKQFGSVWAELQQSGALDRARGAQVDHVVGPGGAPSRVNDDIDPELAAMLDLQSRPNAAPGKSNGSR